MILILGYSGTGKTEIVKNLTKKYNARKVVTWTTRARRPNEVGGVDYNFCTDEEFKKLESIGFFAETTSYVMAGNKKVYYGTAIEDLVGDRVIIVNPYGFKVLTKLNSLNIKSFLITTPINILEQRLVGRGDDRAEFERRLKADESDFQGIESLVDYQVLNDGSKTLEELADYIWERRN